MIILFDFDKMLLHLRRQTKRKRALLESNLSGINLTVTEMSGQEGVPQRKPSCYFQNLSCL